jgi:hypothetical protein
VKAFDCAHVASAAAAWNALDAYDVKSVQSPLRWFAAAEFMAAFYETLFAGKTVSEAVAEGRRRL